MANKLDRYAVVNADGLVESVIIWRGNPYNPGEGKSLIYGPAAEIGDIYDFSTSIFTKPARNSKDIS